jgi:hypothetical protein
VSDLREAHLFVCNDLTSVLFRLDLTEEGQTKAVGSSMDFTFPPELAESLRLLYYLRRGPLVSPGPVQSSDDRAEKRSLFLRLPLDDCLNMMAPIVWTTGALHDPKLVVDVSLRGTAPPETLVLWDNVSSHLAKPSLLIRNVLF